MESVRNLHTVLEGSCVFLKHSSIIAVLDGKWDGPWVRYHDIGRIYQKGTYKNGKNHGPWVYYHNNGQLHSIGSYKDGEKDSPWVPEGSFYLYLTVVVITDPRTVFITVLVGFLKHLPISLVGGIWCDTKSSDFVSRNEGEDYRLFSVVIFGFCRDDFVSITQPVETSALHHD